MVKYVTEIVSGDCPECAEATMLVAVQENFYKCINCGEVVEQKVNGVIKYMKVKKNDKMCLRIDGEELDG